MKNKSFVFVLGMLSTALAIPFAKGDMIVSKADGETVDTGTFDVAKVQSSNNNLGFYFVLDSTNSVPFDPNWSYTSYCSEGAVTIISNGVSTSTSVPIKKISQELYYLCLSDVGKEATEDGYTVVLNGTWSYYHTDTKTYKYTINYSEFSFENNSWSKNITGYSDSELEKYDVVTLKDCGIPDFGTSQATDYEGVGGLNGSSTVATSSDNVTNSLALKFYYSADSLVQDGKTIDIRFRSRNAWDGYHFVFCNAWGPNGVIASYVNNTNISGDIPLGFEPGKKILIEVGAIDIKNTNNVWLYIKINNKLLSSCTVEKVANFDAPRVGMYVCPTGNGATQHFESTNDDYKNVINIIDTPVYDRSNGIKGFYFSLENNSMPFSDDWNTRFYALDKDNIAINGVGYHTYGRDAIVKTSESEYYTIFSDHDIVPTKDSFISLEGVFSNYANGRTTAYRIPEMGLVFDGLNYTQIANPRSYLSNLVDYDIDFDDYDSDRLVDLEAAIESTKSAITNAPTLAKAYVAYANGKVAVEEIAPNDDIVQEKLRILKEETITVLRNYVSLEDYTESNQAIITSIIDNAINAINETTNKNVVLTLLENAKRAIDEVPSKRTDWEKDVIDQVDGFEAHLESYDIASLEDINHDTMEFAEDGDGFYSVGNHDTFNTFAASEGNTNGNVIFQFKYLSNSLKGGKYGSTAFIRLRGESYFGYRFNIGRENGDVSIDRFYSDSKISQVSIAGSVLTPNVEHIVQIGAIDLKQFDRTWLFIKVDGNIVCNVFTDSIDFAVNPRICFADSFVAEGVKTTISNYGEGTTCSNNAINVGRAKLSQTSSTNRKIYLTLPENDLPFDASGEITYYPTSKSCIKVNGVEVAKPSKFALAKLSETEYCLNLETNNIPSINENDEIVLSGVFARYDSDQSKKLLFSIMDTTFIYHSNGYEYFATLEEIKVDAIFELQNYSNPALYDDAGKAQLDAALASGIAAINAATSAEEVADALANAKQAIDAIVTILQAYKNDAIKEIKNYKNSELSNYRDAQKEEIASIKEQTIADIRVSKSTDEVDLIVLRAKQAINLVKTDAQLLEEELVECKLDAKREIQNFYGELDLDAYTDENVEQINSLTTRALADVETATSKEQVRSIVDTYKNAVAAIEKIRGGSNQEKEDKKGCGGSIIGATAVLTSVSVLGLTLILLKKKEDK